MSKFSHRSKVICAVSVGGYWNLWIFANRDDDEQAVHWHLESRFNDAVAFGTSLVKQRSARFAAEHAIHEACMWLLLHRDWNAPVPNEPFKVYAVLSDSGIFDCAAHSRPDCAAAQWIATAIDTWGMLWNELENFAREKRCFLFAAKDHDALAKVAQEHRDGVVLTNGYIIDVPVLVDSCQNPDKLFGRSVRK